MFSSRVAGADLVTTAHRRDKTGTQWSRLAAVPFGVRDHLRLALDHEDVLSSAVLTVGQGHTGGR